MILSFFVGFWHGRHRSKDPDGAAAGRFALRRGGRQPCRAVIDPVLEAYPEAGSGGRNPAAGGGGGAPPPFAPRPRVRGHRKPRAFPGKARPAAPRPGGG